ncbi:MAG: dihydrolipoyl dehydrogenase [Erysipelotrichaceae bacterium]|nr:dihydrolipoyl dehydrogenase [Erysipelotrichaceae bacterium]
MSDYNYDVIILGAGPGGYETALKCRRHDLSVCLIEKDQVGGTCLNRGCIPTKALLYGSEKLTELGNLEVLGITVDGYRFDYSKLAAYKDSVVGKLRGNVEMMLKKSGVSVVKGFGRLKDSHTVTVNDEDMTADNIILATGSSPFIPPIKGIENAISSDQFLTLESLDDDNWVIVGGGVIGMEIAFVLGQLGKQVTVLEMMPSILPGVDASILKWLNRSIKKLGIKVITSARVEQIDSNSVSYTYKDKLETKEFDRCLVATGRKNNIDGIGLEEAGIIRERNRIPVDEHLRTNVENIYAIGDITGIKQLAHVATYQGNVALMNILGKKTAADYSVVPSCIFVTPTISTVGLSEKELTEKGIVFSTVSYNVGANGKALLSQKGEGTVIIYYSPENGEILGCQMIADGSSEMINELSLAIKNKLGIREIATLIHPHPTVGEIVKEACEKGC